MYAEVRHVIEWVDAACVDHSEGLLSLARFSIMCKSKLIFDRTPKWFFDNLTVNTQQDSDNGLLEWRGYL